MLKFKIFLFEMFSHISLAMLMGVWFSIFLDVLIFDSSLYVSIFGRILVSICYIIIVLFYRSFISAHPIGYILLYPEAEKILNYVANNYPTYSSCISNITNIDIHKVRDHLKELSRFDLVKIMDHKCNRITKGESLITKKES